MVVKSREIGILLLPDVASLRSLRCSFVCCFCECLQIANVADGGLYNWIYSS